MALYKPISTNPNLAVSIRNGKIEIVYVDGKPHELIPITDSKDKAILIGGDEDWSGHVVEDVECSTIWTPFEEYIKTNLITRDGYMVYVFNKKR